MSVNVKRKSEIQHLAWMKWLGMLAAVMVFLWGAVVPVKAEDRESSVAIIVMEFCQIQLNYLDWEFQGAKDKMKLLEEYHIPVWVMEPLRGG